MMKPGEGKPRITVTVGKAAGAAVWATLPLSCDETASLAREKQSPTNGKNTPTREMEILSSPRFVLGDQESGRNWGRTEDGRRDGEIQRESSVGLQPQKCLEGKLPKGLRIGRGRPLAGKRFCSCCAFAGKYLLHIVYTAGSNDSSKFKVQCWTAEVYNSI